MASDRCGATSGALICDRAPHVDGDHRGYDDEHDAVLFWPTAAKRIAVLADQIAAALEELDTDPAAREIAVVTLRLAMSRPSSRSGGA